MAAAALAGYLVSGRGTFRVGGGGGRIGAGRRVSADVFSPRLRRPAKPQRRNIAGGDGMLGAPQDLNHNGVRDNPPEAPFSTDDVVLVFEDYDGVIDVDGCHA